MTTTATTKGTKTITRPNGDLLVITAEAPTPGHDHFAITLEGWERRGSWTAARRREHGMDIDFGGADHELILKVAPNLKPIVDVHLADKDGVPMHAVADGWYFYSGDAARWERAAVEKGQTTYARDLEVADHDRAARALHITPNVLPQGLDRAGFEEFTAGLALYWREQARIARDLIARMGDDA